MGSEGDVRGRNEIVPGYTATQRQGHGLKPTGGWLATSSESRELPGARRDAAPFQFSTGKAAVKCDPGSAERFPVEFWPRCPLHLGYKKAWPTLASQSQFCYIHLLTRNIISITFLLIPKACKAIVNIKPRIQHISYFLSDLCNATPDHVLCP